ncbi:MAG: LptA/OstA family protein [Synechococcales bacterium]|nr:LptA/OstA family protein [Synechococcales bacterium]
MSQSPKLISRLLAALLLPAAGLALPYFPAAPIAAQTATKAAPAQTSQAMKLRANVTEANAKTGIVVARGNVQIDYPARQIQATAAQAIYYSKEGRMVLSGNVYILQEGNSLRGETITYLVNEGRFVAIPQQDRQVEAIYIVKETASNPPAPAPVPTNPAPVKPTKVPFPTLPKASPLPTAPKSSN